MKMVKGRSLAQILDTLREGSAIAGREFTLSKLLNVLVSVCNALAYAHALGVVHRDIKPANIMVGDFGEVYVMDWGLAKVLPGETDSESPFQRELPTALVSPEGTVLMSQAGKPAPKSSELDRTQLEPHRPESSSDVLLGVQKTSESSSDMRSASGKVVTNRSEETDLTREGTVMGTPMYMPPEQANGQVHAIGRRSDIYSLGAILYEVLVLEPPVEKGGGFVAVLQRVIHNEIIAPEKRSPQRAREGKIPPDLAAIAMKALARDPAHRYAKVEDFRRDIELFQEGRSVSAKEDSRRELLIKFVKRNRAMSAAVGIAVMVITLLLLGSSWIFWRAARRAEDLLVKTAAAQEKLHDQRRKAVPALVESAQLAVDKRRFDKALSQVSVALDYDRNYPEALLLHGQLLLVVQKDFDGARKEFEQFLRLRPNDEAAHRLRDVCGKIDSKDPTGQLLIIAYIFIDQGSPALAEGLLQQNAFQARDMLLQIYRRRLGDAYKSKDLGIKLTMDETGIYSLNLTNQKEFVSTLAPLKGMPLSKLFLTNCVDVNDLSPLDGMPLTALDLSGCTRVRDLSPLAGMPLTILKLNRCGQVQDLTPLKDSKLTSVELQSCDQVRDLTPLLNFKLTSIILPGNAASAKGMAGLRDMTTLTKINGRSTEDFWKTFKGK
jgi:serine/threonine protein kinase